MYSNDLCNKVVTHKKILNFFFEIQTKLNLYHDYTIEKGPWRLRWNSATKKKKLRWNEMKWWGKHQRERQTHVTESVYHHNVTDALIHMNQNLDIWCLYSNLTAPLVFPPPQLLSDFYFHLALAIRAGTKPSNQITTLPLITTPFLLKMQILFSWIKLWVQILLSKPVF